MEKSSLTLSSLSPSPRSKHRRKRIGFGEGSGRGKTSGKGNKGHRARSGYKSSPGFEGGQMPLHRRLPKVGFTSRKKVNGENIYSLISLVRLEELAQTEGNVISIELLRNKGLIKSSAPKVKILGKEGLKTKLTIETHAVSEGARAAIEKLGGSLTLV